MEKYFALDYRRSLRRERKKSKGRDTKRRRKQKKKNGPKLACTFGSVRPVFFHNVSVILALADHVGIKHTRVKMVERRKRATGS